MKDGASVRRLLARGLALALLFLPAAAPVEGQRPTATAGSPQNPPGDLSVQRWPGSTIPYAGRLSDDAGQPVAGGAYDFSFALYTAEAGGQPLWSEVQTGVAVDAEGAFSTSLGLAGPIPADVLSGGTLWLAVGVRGSGESDFADLVPRQQVSAVAPSSVTADAACPHDHFGESWIGDTPGHGLMIQNSGATGQGLLVYNAGATGVSVANAGFTGVWVYNAGNTGVRVESAGDDGMYVNEAGTPSLTSPSNYKNGFEVAGAEGSGLYVGHADLDGVTVHSAEWYGVYVEQADVDGVRVDAAGGNGVVGTSVSAMYYGGLFRNEAAGGSGLYAAGGDNTAPDLVLGAYGSGDDGRIYSYPHATSSDILLFSNDEVHIHLDEDNDETGAFAIFNGANTAVFSVDEGGAITSGADAGAYGSRAVYAVQATGDWIEDFGVGQLVDGQATVIIEPVFAQAVNLGEYHVFLTPLGDCPLYIADKTPALFEVRAMDGQQCSIAFDYRLVAKRLGNEALRLEPAYAGPEVED